jgi:hypothetical protein
MVMNVGNSESEPDSAHSFINEPIRHCANSPRGLQKRAGHYPMMTPRLVAQRSSTGRHYFR